jgi:hypothetical protein
MKAIISCDAAQNVMSVATNIRTDLTGAVSGISKPDDTE